VQNAMRGVVRSVLVRVAKSGLPGEHHFYIAFRTDAPGVSVSKRLKEKYPEEMTVVLQHRFWDLIVKDDYFEVKLTFDSIPERLLVPFDAIKVFFDPSVPYGLQFEDFDAGGSGTQQLPGQEEGLSPKVVARDNDRTHDPIQSRADKKPRATRRPQPEKAGERAPAASAGKVPGKSAPTLVKPAEPAPAKAGPKVVSIDAFRKK
jgi:hypothetical protein